jgi:hypothetical protein
MEESPNSKKAKLQGENLCFEPLDFEFILDLVFRV